MDNQMSKKLKTAENEQNTDSDIMVLTRNQQPLLNPLILNKILEYCKYNHSEKSIFASLRLVCKLWDDECCTFLRRETEIPIPRLLEPYPNGLGWEEYRPDCFSYFEQKYNCPYPTTREFQNFQLTSTCESFKDRNVHRWFSLMGWQVESLHFICPLDCFHQNDYLAKILQKWCPNLETLHLDGIQCFSSLIYSFESNYKACKINCGKLKNLTISVENNNFREDCKSESAKLPPMYFEIFIRNQKVLMEDFKEMIYLLPEQNSTSQSETCELLYHAFGLSDKESYATKLEKSGVDWGVLGQILKTAPLEKLVIKKLANVQQAKNLVTFLLTQPSKLRSTLKHLEFHNAPTSRFSLKALSLLKCSLSTFIVDKVVWRHNAAKHIYDILSNSAGTLSSFRIHVDSINYKSGDPNLRNSLQIPFLPKLKSFENKNIGLLHVSGLDLLRNAPNLEKCCIDCSSKNRRISCEALEIFCADLNHTSVEDHPLKELKINIVLENRHVNKLSKGLKNLKNVELKVFRVRSFLFQYNKRANWRKIENIKLSVEMPYYLNCVHNYDIEDDKDNCETDVSKWFDKLKSLQFFELTFYPQGWRVLPVNFFREGFKTLRKLTSLKINNMMMVSEEKEESDRSISHIPFVSFPNLTVVSEQELREMF